MVGTWPKPATSKLSLLVRSVKGTGSAAARAAAAGEAGEPSDGGRSCIGASAVGTSCKKSVVQNPPKTAKNAVTASSALSTQKK